MEFFKRSFSKNGEIISVECRRYRKRGRRWSVIISSEQTGKMLCRDDFVSAQFVRTFLAKGVKQ